MFDKIIVQFYKLFYYVFKFELDLKTLIFLLAIKRKVLVLRNINLR